MVNLKGLFSNAFPLLIAVAAVVFAWWMSLAPTPLPESAPQDAISAVRAHKHIAAVCVEPQPAGSKANDRACQYIFSINPERCQFYRSGGCRCLGGVYSLWKGWKLRRASSSSKRL